MDVVMLAQHGITQAVGTLGTATTREHVQLLFKSAPKIVFCFDGDRAGRAAAWRALEQVLPEMQEGRECVFMRSEEHTSELQSLMRSSYAVFCLKKQTNK